MNWIPNGHTRATQLVLDSKINGESEAGYPLTFSLLDGIYRRGGDEGLIIPYITETELQQLSEDDYQYRVDTLIGSVRDEHPEFSIDPAGAHLT